eukprot:TRINITY_DN3463_c0_g1_i2.p1 TRINITY_DN3463_c0_g1~~TRINITY_DN3463_c0_g1_i2.p1  ORF type:complete len:137 (+),score=20.09 TRINITY_DN3463_c0_g1_i2:54-413(+)
MTTLITLAGSTKGEIEVKLEGLTIGALKKAIQDKFSFPWSFRLFWKGRMLKEDDKLASSFGISANGKLMVMKSAGETVKVQEKEKKESDERLERIKKVVDKLFFFQAEDGIRDRSRHSC